MSYGTLDTGQRGRSRHRGGTDVGSTDSTDIRYRHIDADAGVWCVISELVQGDREKRVLWSRPGAAT
jgi:hypothetical protein